MAIIDRIRKLQDAVRAYGSWKDMKARETFTREQLADYQGRRLDFLVRQAVRKSPFYRELYKGIDLSGRVELKDLPVITKKAILDNFDRVVSDPRVKLSAVCRHMESAGAEDLFSGRYHVLTTSGTSGLKGVFLYDRRAWSVILAAVMRASSFMGVPPWKPLRVTSIGGGSPLHLSYRRAMAMDFGLHRIQALLVTSPLSQLVEDLNGFQPQFIHAYPSMATLLAEEQLEGRLSIHPEYLLTGAELVTESMRKVIRRAWGIRPFESYSATEGMLAVQCDHHRGMHLFEDLMITEVVDSEYRPVPDGTPGQKVLLTNLFQFREPLIRYEIPDMVCIDDEPCSCGRPFRMIKAVLGRNDDIFYLEGSSGEPVPIHPMNFHSFFDPFPGIREYRVVLGEEDIAVTIVPRGDWSGADEEELRRTLHGKLLELNVRPPAIRVRRVDSIRRDDRFMGKMIVVEK